MPPSAETRILLLRHGETAQPDRFHGAESDVGLGDRGRHQAEGAAALLLAGSAGPVAAVASSTMRRARETAAPIALAFALEPIVVADLHERRMGPLSGRPLRDGWDDYQATLARWKSGDLDSTHPGGESFRDLQARCVPALVGLASRFPGKTVVVVAHGVVIRVLLCSLLTGVTVADFDRFGIDFVAVNDLRFDGSAWRATELNGHPVDPTPPGEV